MYKAYIGGCQMKELNAEDMDDDTLIYGEDHRTGAPIQLDSQALKLVREWGWKNGGGSLVQKLTSFYLAVNQLCTIRTVDKPVDETLEELSGVERHDFAMLEQALVDLGLLRISKRRELNNKARQDSYYVLLDTPTRGGLPRSG